MANTGLNKSMTDPVVELKLIDLEKRFGGVKAVDLKDDAMIFFQGKVSALIGPNGAGKTTVFNLISGYIQPDSGDIYWRDKKIGSQPSWKAANAGMGRLFQDVRIFGKMTCLENVIVACKKQKGENPLVALFHRGLVKREYRRDVEKARHYLNYAGLSNYERTQAEDLSYGQQKLLAIARLLALESDLLLLDEPIANLDKEMTRKVSDLITRLKNEKKTVVLIEHDLDEIINMADWVIFMAGGRKLFFGLPEEVLRSPEIRKKHMGL